jgi:hypothetical protein
MALRRSNHIRNECVIGYLNVRRVMALANKLENCLLEAQTQCTQDQRNDDSKLPYIIQKNNNYLDEILICPEERLQSDGIKTETDFMLNL